MDIEDRIKATLESLYRPVEAALREPRTIFEICAMSPHDPDRTLAVLDDMVRYGKVVEHDGRYQLDGK